MTKQQLIKTIVEKQSCLCVGLDTEVNKLPACIPRTTEGIVQFNKLMIEATLPYCVGYKINTAFYEVWGSKGWDMIAETLSYIPSSHFTIADAKRGDIGNTSLQYAKTFFETFLFDAVTVSPYMGFDSLQPFLSYKDKCTIVLGLTSNQGAEDFEKQKIDNEFLYEKVIKKVATWGNDDQLMFVVGATQAKELQRIRTYIPSHVLLIPGIGAQGGSLEDVIAYGSNAEVGLLIAISRDIIFTSKDEDFNIAASLKAQMYERQMKYTIQKVATQFK